MTKVNIFWPNPRNAPSLFGHRGDGSASQRKAPLVVFCRYEYDRKQIKERRMPSRHQNAVPIKIRWPNGSPKIALAVAGKKGARIGGLFHDTRYGRQRRPRLRRRNNVKVSGPLKDDRRVRGFDASSVHGAQECDARKIAADLPGRPRSFITAFQIKANGGSTVRSRRGGFRSST